MEKIRKLIVKYTQIILGAVIFVMIFSNFVQMITRYFINMTVVWVEDVSVLGLYWLFGLGVPMAWLMGAHMEMNILEKFMNDRFKLVISYITQGLGIALGVLYIVAGARSISLNKGYVMSIVGFDEMWRYIPIVVCGVLLICAAIFNTVEMIFLHGKTLDTIADDEDLLTKEENV